MKKHTVFLDLEAQHNKHSNSSQIDTQIYYSTQENPYIRVVIDKMI